MENVTRGPAAGKARGRGNGARRGRTRGTAGGAIRGAATLAAVCALALAVSSCSSVLGEDDTTQHKGDDVKIGLLLPEKETARYEKFDRPVFEKEVQQLTNSKGSVTYANADGKASTQEEQFSRMIDQHMDTIVVDSVDAKTIASQVRTAKDAGINVIAYDRLAEGPVDGYVTFDGELVGQEQAQALTEALGLKPGENDQKTKIVMINGASNDPNTALFKKGALRELSNRVTIAKSYDTADWKPSNARAHMADAIKELGGQQIDGVYSANDGMAGGIIDALKSAGISPLPPVTGQDAELTAVQRVISGEQYMSVYKPYRDEAAAAAKMAVKISQHRMVEYDALAMDRSQNSSTKRIPSHLVQVQPLTKSTVKATVVRDKIYTVRQICTSKYTLACQEAGLE